MSKLISKDLEYINKHDDRIIDIAYTLNQHREHLSYRSFCTVSANGLITKAATITKLPATTPSIAMIFSGQGAQWPAMGRDLILANTDFRMDIEAMDCILQGLQHPPPWRIKGQLLQTKSSQIHNAEFAQPLCTAVQIAIVNLFRRACAHPAAVVGHSSGEIAAAYAADAISLREAIITSYYRGYVGKSSTAAGSMAAVGLSADAASSFLIEGVVIACENSPSSVTISGDSEALEKVLSSIKQIKPDVLARPLKVDMAYHSRESQYLPASSG